MVNSFEVKTTISMLEQRICVELDAEVSNTLMEIIKHHCLQKISNSKIIKVERVKDDKFFIYFITGQPVNAMLFYVQQGLSLT